MAFLQSPLHDRMVFLVGARRSGTNWLFRLLTSHPSIAGIPAETYLFAMGLSPLSERFHHGVASSSLTGSMYLERNAMLQSFRDLADRAFAGVADRLKPDAERIIEHTPWHARHLDLIGDVYPDAWVIHIIRDGRDVAGSLVRQPWGPRTVREAAQEWNSTIRDARASAPPRYREVRYEQLMLDATSGMRELFEWLGLPCSTDLLDAVARESNRAYNVDASNPTITEGKWRATFSPTEVAEFDAAAGGLLHELGYPAIESVTQRPAPLTALATTGKRWAHAVTKRRAQPVQLPTPGVFHRLLTLANAVTEALDTNDVGRLAPMLAASAKIRVATNRGLEGLGPAGLQQLAREIAISSHLRTRQLHGDVYPNPSGFTAVLAYEGEDAQHSCSVLIVKADPRSPTPIQAITYHGFTPMADRS